MLMMLYWIYINMEFDGKLIVGPNESKLWNIWMHAETHNKRQATQDDCMPMQLAGRWGQMNWNSVRWAKDIFCAGLTRWAKAGQKRLYRHDKPNEPTKEGRTPFICTLWVSIYLNFNSQQGPLLSCLSGCAYTVHVFMRISINITTNKVVFDYVYHAFL
jgi:hypothetical protein